MQREMYKIDIIKLVLLVVVLTTAVVLMFVFVFNFFLQGGSPSLKKVTEKISKRITKGIVNDTKKQTTPERALLEAINSNRSRVVKIYSKLETGTDLNNFEERNKKFLARGIIVSKDGNIATTKGGFRADKEYSIIIPGNKEIFSVRPSKISQKLAFFKIPTEFGLIANLDSSRPQKNSLVVAIAGREKDGMAVGKILKIKSILNHNFFVTTIPPKVIEAGTPLINQQGKIIGIYSTSDKEEKERSLFITGKEIKKAISEEK